ncbi:2-amino-4-hydroxy-6-hydroxymethyldihydropteridine diphosphokinase [Hydrocarboniclastica marina]|uniref:2-amino-4-hydroxy-6-hydroxymethyldihydropteridine diphosphokinase n=1 Tax=Hydrocarboniclastica marina TaxID=2259620 RepID=A0A4P7XFL7_9ALTE|nr:2-amino-4-hydroxy-6-hydroxymethyldihydropteridine diphosphokinase [Hydrocarboniclastica marina]QCF24912.1 2-amino-4-hydroxy-6-hydroxymethyldihydropteridine diphosphokinase [Hydrocarboniclastica marina]
MSYVYLGVGSNQDPVRHVRLALDALGASFGGLTLSPVYESEPVGFTGRNFLNLVVGLETDLSIGGLRHRLKELEEQFGRKRDGTVYGQGALDIDLLLYDDLVGSFDGVELPRPEIVLNAFVLRPLAEIAPGCRHPVLDLTFSELWANYDCHQRLWRVPFSWRGTEL